MSPAELVKMRLRTQHISGTTFTQPGEVVSWLGAVQAQDFLGALWAIGLRLRRAREPDVERALIDGSIVRTWPLRGTLHFVAASDARWMVELLGPRMIARAAHRFRALGLDETTYARARRVLVKRLERGALSRRAAYDALEGAGVAVAGQRGIHILWRLAQECVLCFGPRAGKEHTFVLFDAWVPHAGRVPRDEALAELAFRYFRGHGPATTADFAWWSGLTVSDARRAVALAGSRLEEKLIAGRPHFDAPPASVGRARSSAFLLPAFDEFVVAYADRSAAVAPANMPRVNAGGGLLKPTLLVDGKIVGTWGRRLVRKGVSIAPVPFVALNAHQRAALALAEAHYVDFLGFAKRDAAGNDLLQP